MSNTKARILAAATDLFSTRGYTGTTLTDIADAVKLRPPAIYRHYQNKEQLYEAVLDNLFAPFTKLVASLEDYEGEVDVETFLTPIAIRCIETPAIVQIVFHATLAGGTQLEYLTRRWYVPLFDKVLSALPGESPVAAKSSIINFHSFLLGYIGLAALHRQIFGVNPLEDGQLEQHLALQAKISEMLS